jgi:GMC oxidoreductase
VTGHNRKPYRGAQPYRYADRDLYFGRDTDVRDLLERLGASRGVLLYGPPGAGRTSLIEAGLVPATDREVVSVRLRARGELVVHDDGEHELTPDELRARLADRRALVIFDDFDAVVTLVAGAAPPDVVALVRDLLAAEHVQLLLSMREERLAPVLELLPETGLDRMRLTAPPLDALDEIVLGPFRAHGGQFERSLSPAVAAAVVEACERRGATRPLDLTELQVALLRLWEADNPETLLARYGLGGLAGDDRPPATPSAPEAAAADAEDAPLEPEERRLRVLLLAHAAWSALLAIGYIVDGDTRSFGFVANSFSKDVLFVALSLLAAWHLRRHGWLTLLVVAGYAGLVAGQIAALAWGGSPRFMQLGMEVEPTTALLGWMVIDVALAVWFAVWWSAAVRARWRLRYLNPLAFLALIAVTEVVIEGEREAISPREIAHNVDGYLARLQSRSKGRIKLALSALAIWPLLSLRPPLPMLAPDARKQFLERRFIAAVAQRRALRPLRPLLQAMIRLGSQLAYLGYYGDKRSWPSIGYRPYRRRPGGRAPERRDQPERPLKTLPAPPGGDYDTIVIGSGAAGGILAYRLATAGKRVLVLERGPYVDPREFTDDEVDQYLRLYNEGALQLATDFRLQVLQGMCVGGGTTVNNALCLDPPGEVLDDWARHGVARGELEQAVRRVRELLPVGPIHEATMTSVAARRFGEAAVRMNLPGRVELLEVNISSRCLGCGYCNIGCAYGAKLSTLDTVLPWAQRDDRALDVLADFEVTEIVRDGDRAVGVNGRWHSGERHFLGADEVVVAAGAVQSSYLLQRSGIGGSAVGRGLHFNINSPLTAEFPEPVDAFTGLQISHAYVPRDGVPGYLVETWFNPPATQSLSMPGWFDRHFQNMLRYRYMAADHLRAVRDRPAAAGRRPQADGAHLPGRGRAARDAGHLRVARVP